MREHYSIILRDTERHVERSLKIQNLDRESPYYGAFAQTDGVYQAKSSIYRVAGMIAAYCNEDTRFYHDGRVFERKQLGLDDGERAQHVNGLFE